MARRVSLARTGVSSDDLMRERREMHSASWSKGIKASAAALSAALMIAVAGCERPPEAIAETPGPSDEAQAQGGPLTGAFVEEPPNIVDAWKSDEVKNFPESEQRIAVINEALHEWSTSMEQLLTPGGYSDDYYDSLKSYMAEDSTFDEYLTGDLSNHSIVIPTLSEDDGMPSEEWKTSSINSKQVPESKVVGEPRIYYGNVTSLIVYEDEKDVERLSGRLAGVFELDLANGSVASYQFTFEFNSAEGGDPGQLWGWSSRGALLGVS